MSIKFTDAAKHFKGTKEQIEAFEYLQENTLPYVLEEFEKLYRKKPEVKLLITKKQLASICSLVPLKCFAASVNLMVITQLH